MRLATVRTPDGTAAVRVDVEGAEGVETGHGSVDELLRDPAWRSIAASADGPVHDLTTTERAPLVTRPDKVICVGLNYLDHIAETGGERPVFPTLFPKFANSLVGASEPIELPLDTESTRVDWEAELGVVIGSSIRRASSDGEAAAAIAGYTVVNDISVRDFQRHTAQFMPGKAWERSTPVGPDLLVTDGSIDAARPAFDISCDVDGQRMQSSNTRELCFGPLELIRYASTFTTLEPGDLIVTGTPGGVGVARTPPVFLQRGQTVVTRIDGVGELTNHCA